MASSAFVANMEQPLMVCVAPEDCEFFYEYFWRQRLEDSEGKASKKPKSSHFPFKVDLSRQLTAEFVGTAWLVATVVGSGIGGDRVSSDDGVALLGNTLATLGCLYVLITIFVKISGAHFNPAVSLAFCLRREMKPRLTACYVVAQFAGAFVGTLVAHLMWELPAVSWDGKTRDTAGEVAGEAVATFGLLLTIFGCIGSGNEREIPLAVALFVASGYWYTSSTAFANPAVTFGRCFTDSFAGIRPQDYGRFLGGQALGFVVALPFYGFMYEGSSIHGALGVLWRRPEGHVPKKKCASPDPSATQPPTVCADVKGESSCGNVASNELSSSVV
eukprot:m.77207 g.77207  ORF g.77207 m.77207 type:complete len:331 (-) comp19095_c0_seq2:154-1146(-)